ncbi:uncharacterized protein KY384_008422 [Bacidia gigantensis]|uniref:uncharacterized protein n=1 Tax=Bacidia gigantensis TaxID=2732470 RepID=UPI001D043798|nr:uncharacterized protein KY384_008422 [Bacidia gigantensis]KAG8526993.1 hypothetical protein KY384_008422 [Bacidia gigantensis]
MAPLIGTLSDNSRSKWGRRRPFMVIGGLVVSTLLLVLGRAAEIATYFVPDSEKAKSFAVVLAVATIYVLDFAINVVQSCCRSLIVDTLPIAKQQIGSAWASRMISIGNIVTYAVGTIDLVSILGPTFGDTQFKHLTIIAAAFFTFSVCLTSWAVEERVLVSSRESDGSSSVFKTFSTIVRKTRHLPKRIQAICWVQFWAWIGWFPFMFYSTTWVGEVYFRFHPEASTKDSKDAVGDVGRVGTLALVIFSLITFTASVVLPSIVRSPEEMTEKRSFTPRPHPALTRVLSPFAGLTGKSKPDLLSAWQAGHIIFAGAMCLAPFVTSFRMATIIVSICGIPWMIAGWAPYAFMGVEINRMTAPNKALENGLSHRRRSGSESPPQLLRLNHLDRDIEEEKDTLLSPESGDNDSTTGETAGIYLGILNIFSTVPQLIGSFISMVVFSILEPGISPELNEGSTPKDIEKAKDRPNGIAVCLFIGALSALGAAYATTRMRALWRN